jgi:small-conductance mechanosensitive channel
MLAGIHFFSASAIALNFASNYLIALIIGFIVHHLEDSLPHLDLNIFQSEKLKSIKDWDYKIWFVFWTEFLFFFLLTFYFLTDYNLAQQLLALTGGFGALLPDIISFSLNSFFPQIKILDFYKNFHKNFHFKLKNKNYFLPILIELLIILLAIYLLRNPLI